MKSHSRENLPKQFIVSYFIKVHPYGRQYNWEGSREGGGGVAVVPQKIEQNSYMLHRTV